jgi:serine/threonine protein kinase
MSSHIYAAQELEGRTLFSGWKVLRKINYQEIITDSALDDFSVYYEVEREGQVCFMKAIDFSKYMSIKIEGQKTTQLLSKMLEDYHYERDLSLHCQKKRVTKVAFVIDSDEEDVDDYIYGVVPYLIFEKADGDVREMLAYNKKMDFAWKMKSLHDIAVGLQQLHSAGVSHQNLKPSNVLLFKGDSKIGDLGKALCPELNEKLYDVEFRGDFSYEPPELLYGYPMQDWQMKSYLADCYVLGSLIVFYLIGVTMNGVLFRYLPENFHPATYTIPFDAVKDYLMDAFEKALVDIDNSLGEFSLKQRIMNVIRYLCCPDPMRRGHPKTIESVDSNYNLERFISELNYLYRKAEIDLIKG